MKFEELQFIVLNKRAGLTKKGQNYYQIRLGSNVGFSTDIFVKEEVYNNFSIFEVVTQYVILNYINNKLTFSLVI